MALRKYSKTKPNSDERTFDLFLRKDTHIHHYVFSVWYNSGQGNGSGGGDVLCPYDILTNQLINLEVNRDEKFPNKKPIKTRFHGKTFEYYSGLEDLLKIYARSENVPIEFEYLPPVRRK